MDVTACIPGDIIKPGEKLGNTPGAPEGASENHNKLLFLNIFVQFKKKVFVVSMD